MGEYVLRGRGPGEALSPNIRGSFHDSLGRECLYVFDISLGRSYGLDLAKSIKEGKTEIFPLTDFPVQPLDAYLYRDTLQFVTVADNDRQLYRIMGLDGKELKTFDILYDISADVFLPQLSECVVLNHEEGLAALLSPLMAPDALESFLARALTAAAGFGAAAVQAEGEEDG